MLRGAQTRRSGLTDESEAGCASQTYRAEPSVNPIRDDVIAIAYTSHWKYLVEH